MGRGDNEQQNIGADMFNPSNSQVDNSMDENNEQQNFDGDTFNPSNLRVLALDANVVSLRYLVVLLQKCGYKVTSTTLAAEALKILRENMGEFDIVITDVVRLDMDGFKLLEIIGLEMDLPIIMVSGEESRSSIMKGIKHGARDYLLKPVRMQEIKNIWQHVVRKRLFDSSDKSSITKEKFMPSRKHKLASEEEEEDDHSNNACGKKARVTWSSELHFKFVEAIQTLETQGEKIHPKRIREIMNVDGLTRENIASHLQKYRNMLRKHKTTIEHEDELGADLYSHGWTSPIQVKAADGSQPSTSSFVNRKHIFLKPNHQNVFEQNVQSPNLLIEQGMLNNVPAVPASNMLAMQNYLPPPQFKGLNFSNYRSSWKLPNEYIGTPSQLIGCEPGSSLLYPPPPLASLNTSLQKGILGHTSSATSLASLFPPVMGTGKNERGSFANLYENVSSNIGNKVSPAHFQKGAENQVLIDIPKDDEARLFMEDEINEMVKQFNNDGIPRL